MAHPEQRFPQAWAREIAQRARVQLPKPPPWSRDPRDLCVVRNVALISRAAFSFAHRLAWRLHIQEVANHLVATLGEHAFRMKLHALNGQRSMPQTHDHGASAILRCSRGYGKLAGE
jgi:hypothetical protein